MAKAMMVMPAIYKFEGLSIHVEPYYEVKEWGWHKAKDLLDVVNNIRKQMGEDELTADDIVREYKIDVGKKVGYSSDLGFDVCDGEKVFTTSPPTTKTWLGLSIEHNYYLPAKIGMDLITAVKNPLRHAKRAVAVFRKAISGQRHG